MWPTVDGLRQLKDAEADLVRQAIQAMLPPLIDEHREDSPPNQLGIDWFDQWEADGRIWLLEQVAVALLTNAPPPSPAAMWEATIDAIFCVIVDKTTAEIENQPADSTWRQRGIEAFRCQHGRPPQIDLDEPDPRQWRRVATQIADAILGSPSYQKAEAFRDGDIEQCRRFLIQRGLPDDFLERIPPLRSEAQTDASIAAIQAILSQA